MLCLIKAGTLHERNLQTATEMNLKMEERIWQFYLIGTKTRKRRINKGIKLNGSTTTDELRRHIQEYCSLTETDVLAVLDALSHFVGRELGEGRQVHLDGIGYFVPTLTCTEPVTLETKRKSTKVKLKNITFRPDKALRSEIGVLKIKPLKLRNLTKKRLTDDEVKQKVVNYLRKNEFITRSVVQSICGMTRTTATRQIRRLCEENVLVNKGLQKQPIYFLKEKE